MPATSKQRANTVQSNKCIPVIYKKLKNYNCCPTFFFFSQQAVFRICTYYNADRIQVCVKFHLDPDLDPGGKKVNKKYFIQNFQFVDQETA